ncbi:MAG: T9SS type A sorting domain-containing protein, partial [Bacteroidales bacterium]|nr:T9SS type A sorting domain-containing protein [Bacteroidales bacterium]
LEIIVNDMLGKQVYRNAKVAATETQLELDTLCIGVYFITVVGEEGIVTKQFIKQ